MSHARLIFEDTPDVISVPTALRHRKTEVIFLSLDEPEDIIHKVKTSPRTLLDLIGKGQGCFKTSKEIDAFVREERDAWEG